MQNRPHNEWPGPDDDPVIDAMLNDSDSHHWGKCQTFVNKLVLKLASNFSVESKDEIAQNAMLSIVRYLPNFKRECRLTSWIVKIVKSRIADAGRIQQTASWHQALSPSDSDEDKENEAYNSKISSLRTAEEESILREELREVSKDLLDYLSNRKHSARNIRILEMHINGFSHEEIARKLHMPPANVGYVIHSTQRALQRLRRLREQK